MRFQTVSIDRSAALRSRVLSYGEDLLDRVQVGAVGRQEEQVGASLSDRLPDGFALVATEIVHDDHVAGLERGHETLLHPGGEGDAVDRAIEDIRRIDPVGPERG